MLKQRRARANGGINNICIHIFSYYLNQQISLAHSKPIETVRGEFFSFFLLPACVACAGAQKEKYSFISSHYSAHLLLFFFLFPLFGSFTSLFVVVVVVLRDYNF